MRRLVILVTILAIFVASGGTSALADNEILLTVPGGQGQLQPQSNDTRDPATEYIRQKLYPGRHMLRAKWTAGASLTGPAKVLYTKLMADISAVANGTRTSTIFDYPVDEIYLKYVFTKEELGADTLLTIDDAGKVHLSYEAERKLGELFESLDIDTVLGCLLADAPFELYWYDKSQPTHYGYPGYGCDGNTLYLSGSVNIKMVVAEDYATEGTGTVSFEVDSKYGKGVTDAAANARIIADRHKGKTDYARLAAYRDEICALTSYNDEAATGNISYGNPWQVIWVFDEDPNTNVVCEGYAKAFQYLNELSGDADVSVICVTGLMIDETGSENHMWNIVNMDNGKNYMADITNCDMGETGSDDLFLVGYTDGSVAEGYIYTVYDWSSAYIYQGNPYSDDALEVWDKSYLESLALKPDTAPVYSLSSDTGYAGYRCAIQLDAPYEAVYIQETDETLVPDSEGLFVISEQPIGNEDVTFTIASVREGFKSPYGVTLTLADGTLDGNLDFPDGLTEIEQEAFRGAGVTAAVFPESIQIIGEYAFADNPDLKLIELHGQQVGEGAFSNCPQAVYCIDEEEIGQYFAEGKKFLVKE